MLAETELRESTTRRLRVELAAGREDVEAAQRLRYEVFAQELGAHLASSGEIDRDGFDDYCDHLVARDGESGRIVGTYRILPGDRSSDAGGFYAETEFDLRHLDGLRSRMVEVGRACVDPTYRNGAVLWQLWGGLTRYVFSRGYQFVIGCGSIGLSSGGHVAASICRRVRTEHAAPAEWRVEPYRPFPVADFVDHLDVPVPPLIAGYLSLGAVACGPPAWDVDFNTADLLLLLPLARLNPRYANRLLRAA